MKKSSSKRSSKSKTTNVAQGVFRGVSVDVNGVVKSTDHERWNMSYVYKGMNPKVRIAFHSFMHRLRKHEKSRLKTAIANKLHPDSQGKPPGHYDAKFTEKGWHLKERLPFVGGPGADEALAKMDIQTQAHRRGWLKGSMEHLRTVNERLYMLIGRSEAFAHTTDTPATVPVGDLLQLSKELLDKHGELFAQYNEASL